MSMSELKAALDEVDRPTPKAKPEVPANGELNVKNEAGLAAFLKMAGVRNTPEEGNRPATTGIGDISPDVLDEMGDDSLYFASPISGKVIKGKRTVEIIDEITEVIYQDMDQMCPEACPLKDAAFELVRAFNAMSKAVIIVNHDEDSCAILNKSMKDVGSMSVAMLTAAQNLLAIGKALNIKKRLEQL
jgi:hypothetical protein